MTPTEIVKERFQRLCGEVGALRRLKTEAQKRVGELEKRQETIAEAQQIVIAVAQATQRQIEYQISDLATTAMASVFPDPYEMKLSFELKRNRSEAQLRFMRGDKIVNPMEASEGGAVDVAAFALRVSLWLMKRRQLRNTIIMDEPFRFVSPKLHPVVGDMLKAISHNPKIRVQLLVVTHSDGISSRADRIFRVTIRRRITNIEREV